MIKIAILGTTLLSLGLALPALASDSKSGTCSASVGKSSAMGESSILETAAAAGSFKTLAAAVRAAGLADALSGPGPFTVFAPTDEAFAKLPAGTLESLLLPENKAKLAGILTYHVVPGKVLAADVVKLRGALTLNGQRLDIAAGESVRIDQANVLKTDIGCTNGVIHVIDSVMLPSMSDITATAASAGTFKTLLAAAKAAGLVETLQKGGPFTVFAPNDEAFAKLPAGTVENLLLPENKQKLADLLKFHIVQGRVYSEAVVGLKEAPSLLGQALSVRVDKVGVFIAGAKLVATDIDASNGVVHVVDTVLMPKG